MIVKQYYFFFLFGNKINLSFIRNLPVISGAVSMITRHFPQIASHKIVSFFQKIANKKIAIEIFSFKMMSNTNKLYLIPTPIGKRKENFVLPEHTLEVIKKLNCFIVEKPQTSMNFLQWIGHPIPDYKLTIRVLNKKTPDHEVFSFISLMKEQDVGLMSEAGAPGVADPGAALVNLAHEGGYRVVPLVGPSSVLLALMASGLNGQNFAFHGYLPLRDADRLKELSALEEESKKKHRTQIFMETPHRNNVLIDILLKKLHPSTRLCIACNITQPDEFIQTKRIYNWKESSIPDLQKKPCLFLINSA